MLYIDYAKFKCPYCNERIYITGMKGQGFADRLERPKPFLCPFCHQEVIFYRTPGRIFQFGVLTSFFIAFPWLLITAGDTNKPMWLGCLGFFLIALGMFTQKLIRSKDQKTQSH